MNGTRPADYLRLERPGHVSPVLARVAAYAGNNLVLITPPVVPGAVSDDILRSSNPVSGYVPAAVGMVELVCSGDTLNMTDADPADKNGTAQAAPSAELILAF